MCTVDDEEIESINSLKLLGVVLDNKLNFSEHVKLMCSKPNSKIGVVTKMTKLVPEKKNLLNKSVMLPGLNYCLIVWLFIRASDKRKLERMKEKGLRAVFNDDTSSYENLMFKAKNGTSPFLSRFRDRTLICYKISWSVSMAKLPIALRTLTEIDKFLK